MPRTSFLTSCPPHDARCRLSHRMASQESATSPLQQSEALFRTLLDATFEGIFIHDRVIHYANASAARITGLRLNDLLGKPMAELHDDLGLAMERDAAAFRRPAEGLTYGPIQFRARAGKGACAIIESQGKTILYEGRWLWLSAFRDITPFKVAEENLRQRVAFEDLVTSIAASLIHLSPAHVPEALDDALSRIGRFEEVDRSYIYELDCDMMRCINLWTSHPRRSDWRNRAMEVGEFRWAIEQLRKGQSVVYDVVERNTHDDEARKGRKRSSLCVPMFASGELMGYVGFDALREAQTWREETIRTLRTVGYIFASVLERKRVQDQLTRAYETMEHTVEQRTRELHRKQMQLVQAEKMATLGQLVAGVAHEINTPLGAIRSNTDTLARSFKRLAALTAGGGPAQDETETDRAKLSHLLEASAKMNDVSQAAIERIVGIVGSLRQFARLDQADVDTIDLHEALENTLILVHHQFKHRIEVHKDFGEIPLVECHPQQINQVIMNLLVNAGQAIEGKGAVHVRTFTEGGNVVLEIRDTGKGIPEANVDRIFDPGFTTKGVGVGTGLGLSIVHRIVEEHQGRIEVDSDAGLGATFRVYLPARHLAEHAPAQSHS